MNESFVFSGSVILLKQKLFKEIIPQLAKVWLHSGRWIFALLFLLYSHQSHPISSQAVEDPTLVADLWLRRIINYPLQNTSL